MADNPDELFDVVDREDRVVGQAPRGVVHAEGLLHRAVHVLVQRQNGDFFLQKRSMEKDCHPGCWDSSSSGHLDSGEAYDEAAVRELREELGIEVDQLAQIASLPASEMTGQEFVRIYLARHEGPFTLHPGEISDGRWVSVEELNKWLQERPGDFAPCFHEVWKTIRTT
ncbi:NUDIX domain-containing protein [Puniceicoccales bacterium CK1056]|uniref:NUDIX domain-containing protein n=1 Tax=Oceanipulchritudo coccoides TaxID=2706888 RepID=A0A6B2M110_9BACT|nr:NUDIX domain-containing protein [Oceanipulchritudo coccoides]NDV62092.1 NUDIX domain-containing protein [Oceanipulchritudo coccoides]